MSKPEMYRTIDKQEQYPHSGEASDTPQRTGGGYSEQPTLVTIYTDGACAGNPGPGGWSYIMIRDGVRTEVSGHEPWATNNQMEMRAAIEVLSALAEPSHVEIVSDSEYLVIGITEWIEDWKERFWTTSAGKSVANRSLWQRLDELCKTHTVSWRWIRGHNGDPDNERCDALASAEAGITQEQKEFERLRREKRKEKKGARRTALGH
jgi:ribonuclease HI